MEYRAVGNRCAFDFDVLCPLISREEILKILFKEGFKTLNVDIVKIARERIGKSRYRRGAKITEAPEVVDCSSLIKWLYAQRGIWLPRRSIQQRELGEAIGLSDIIGGDVVFVSGKIDYYLYNPSNGVGHVGIATNDKTVIHAANGKLGVVETPLEEFASELKFRGVRRYVTNDRQIITFETLACRLVETADDIKWIVIQSLPKCSQQ